MTPAAPPTMHLTRTEPVSASRHILAGSYPPPRSINKQYWGTFYYQWYGDSSEGWLHWNEAGHSPPSTWASMYQPDPGSGVFSPEKDLYSGLNQSIIRRQLGLMNMARFDFALASWWGQGDHTDQAFNIALSQLDQQPSLNLRLGIYYEKESIGDPSVQEIVGDLTYIYDHYANSNSYFRVADSDGVHTYPVVFVYADSHDASAYAARWADARAEMFNVEKPFYIVLKVFVGYQNYDGMADSWHQYAAGLRYELQLGYSAFASPGYWEYPVLALSRGRTDQNTPLLSRDPLAFASAVQTMAGLTVSQAKFLLIETFNEYHEGSMIEPAIQINHLQTGFTEAASSYGLDYIQIVRNRGGGSAQELRDQPLQRAPTESDQPLTNTLQDSQQLPIESTRVGQAYAHSAYWIHLMILLGLLFTRVLLVKRRLCPAVLRFGSGKLW